jgi:hypothetical protein
VVLQEAAGRAGDESRVVLQEAAGRSRGAAEVQPLLEVAHFFTRM